MFDSPTKTTFQLLTIKFNVFVCVARFASTRTGFKSFCEKVNDAVSISLQDLCLSGVGCCKGTVVPRTEENSILQSVFVKVLYGCSCEDNASFRSARWPRDGDLIQLVLNQCQIVGDKNNCKTSVRIRVIFRCVQSSMQNRTSTTPQSKLTYDEKQDIQGLYVKEFERESPFLKGAKTTQL